MRAFREEGKQKDARRPPKRQTGGRANLKQKQTTGNGDRPTEGARGEEGKQGSGQRGAHVGESDPYRWGGVEDGEHAPK